MLYFRIKLNLNQTKFTSNLNTYLTSYPKKNTNNTKLNTIIHATASKFVLPATQSVCLIRGREMEPIVEVGIRKDVSGKSPVEDRLPVS